MKRGIVVALVLVSLLLVGAQVLAGGHGSISPLEYRDPIPLTIS